jgi:5'-nucleotidase
VVADGVEGFVVSGFPVDCVKLAFDKLLPEKPDLVVSGINQGANVGSHLFYSGTLAAVMEGARHGVSGVAVSLAVSTSNDGTLNEREKEETAFDFARAAAIFVDVLDRLDDIMIYGSCAINVNIPPDGVETKGVRWVAHHAGPMPDAYHDMGDVDGRQLYQMHVGDLQFEDGEESDRALLNEGYVTLTPLRCDLTCHDTLDRLRRRDGADTTQGTEGRDPS